MTFKVVQLNKASIQDIPAMLRRCAERIEGGEFGEPEAMAAVLRDGDGDLVIFGWGDIDDPSKACGLLSMGVTWFGVHARCRTVIK